MKFFAAIILFFISIANLKTMHVTVYEINNMGWYPKSGEYVMYDYNGMEKRGKFSQHETVSITQENPVEAWQRRGFKVNETL